jgi:hypothetical protein
MFITRETKRSAGEHFSLDSRVDILAGENEVGRLHIKRGTGGAFTLDGEDYVITRTGGVGLGETPLEILARAVMRKPKPLPDHYELKDARGRVLASADQTREMFAIACEAGRFVLAKGPSMFLFSLMREGDPMPLGFVGQSKLRNKAREIDLPDLINRPTQVFVFSLFLIVSAQRAANSMP